MDVYCKRCGEPWDLYGVQHEFTPEERDHFWKGEGCPSCCGMQPCDRVEECEDCPYYDGISCTDGKMKALAKRPSRAELTGMLHEALGEDLDGLAAELEDAEFLLGKEFWE